MKYLHFAFILVFLSPTTTFAASNQPEDRTLTEPPNHGEFVGAKPRTWMKSGIKGKGVGRIPWHPGVVVGGPDAAQSMHVAMVSSNLPHNPPQRPMTDFDSTVRGNIDLSPPKVLPLGEIRKWVNDETRQQEPPLTPHNLAKLKAAMVPHTGWEPPKAPTPPPRSSGKGGTASDGGNLLPNPQGSRKSRSKSKTPLAAQTVQGGDSRSRAQDKSSKRPLPPVPAPRYESGSRGPLPPVPQGGPYYYPSGSRGQHPPNIYSPASNVASSSKHGMVASGSSSQHGSQSWHSQAQVRNPGQPSSRRPNSPSNLNLKPKLSSNRPNPPSTRPYPPPKPYAPSMKSESLSSSNSRRPGSPSKRPGSPSKRPGSPSDANTRVPGPRTKSQSTGKGKGREERSPPRKSRSPSPQPQSSNNRKGKNRERSPPRKPRLG